LGGGEHLPNNCDAQVQTPILTPPKKRKKKVCEVEGAWAVRETGLGPVPALTLAMLVTLVKNCHFLSPSFLNVKRPELKALMSQKCLGVTKPSFSSLGHTVPALEAAFPLAVLEHIRASDSPSPSAQSAWAQLQSTLEWGGERELGFEATQNQPGTSMLDLGWILHHKWSLGRKYLVLELLRPGLTF
jgi:hypothetical protein